MKQNYGDILCQAIEIVSEKMVKEIAFDRTLECTIVDSSLKDQGKYTVLNGMTRFDAYSSTTKYKKGDIVFVTIPNNDFDNQKFITGKKISNSDKPITFITPFDTMLDLTNNIVQTQYARGLVANGTTASIEVFNLQSYQLQPLGGFTRLGIQASFKTWLRELGATSGSFGLRITLTSYTEKAKDGKPKLQNHIITLGETDMYGNPYDFEGFFQQEKVFDISTLGTIVAAKGELYQNSDFVTREGSKIPSKDELDVELMPNIFIKDVYLCAGYDLKDIQEEYVHLYTFDPDTYVVTQTSEQNQKTIHLRWVHMQGEERIVVSPESNLDYEVRWYRYQLGVSSADEYSGYYWERIEIPPKTFEHTLLPDTNRSKEMIKVIILYRGDPVRSNIITFENEKEVLNQPTLDAIHALSIVCGDNTHGNYLIYDKGNNLLDISQSNRDRDLVAHFNSDYASGESVELTEAESITWTFPTVNTMLVVDEGAGPDITVTKTDSTISFTRTNVSLEGKGPHPENRHPYRVKKYFSPQYLNNTVELSIKKGGVVYSAQKSFRFGQAGTTGASSTLVIDFDNNIPAITLGESEAITLTARIYDCENNEVDLSSYTGSRMEWEWSWFNQGAGLEIREIDGEPDRVEIDYSGLTSINNLYIIQVTVKNWNSYDYDLTAYLPIPLRTSKDYKYITGATQVIYLADGTPVYYKNEYTMETNRYVTMSSWSIYPPSSGDISVAEMLRGRILSPPSFYIKDGTPYGAKFNENWMQPILVIQNRYPSAVVNKWDGKTLEIDHDNGSILSTMIASGSKDSQNRFSGVMMGDWSYDSDRSLRTTGLYGFHQGAMSFGFKEDGTGFIGKDGAGRILFDGNKSTIQSELNLSTDEREGMILDFDDGLIKMTSRNGSILLDSKASRSPLRIGDNFRVDWDGSVYAYNAYFEGDVESSNVEMSEIGWSDIRSSTIYSGEVRGATFYGPTFHMVTTSYTHNEYRKVTEFQEAGYYYRRAGFSSYMYLIINTPERFQECLLLYGALYVYETIASQTSGGLKFYTTGRYSSFNIESVTESQLASSYIGEVGTVMGLDSSGQTINVGIDSANYKLGDGGIILRAGGSIGIRTTKASKGIFLTVGGEDIKKAVGLNLYGDRIECTYAADKQHGFYARFA